MNFINSVATQPLSNIKNITELKSIPIDDNWLDYKALNKALECGRRNVAMHLLSQNFRVNNGVSFNTPEITPLHYAVKLNDTELVEQLLAKDAFVTAYDFERNTPLLLAFMLKNDAIVDLLLAYIEKTLNYINAKNNQNLSHLHVASSRKNVNVIKGFLQIGASVTEAVSNESFSWAGYTALHFAVEFKSLEAVKILITASNCSETNNKDSNDRTPLHILHESLDELQIMAYYLEKKGNNVNHTKLSYFDVACLRSDKNLVKKFIENGAQVNDAVSPNASVYPYSTPLHFVVEAECKENVEELLKNEANVNCLNYYEMTPLHLALYAENCETKDGVVDRLYAALQNKEENLTDDYNLSLFHIAVTRNDIETVKKFFTKNTVDINSKVLPNPNSFSNFTALHFAVLYRQLEMAKLLIENGSDVNANDKEDYGTPLHIACYHGNAGLIELLLKNNADVNVFLVNELSTPIHTLAEYFRNKKESTCLQHLLKYVDQMARLGCNINAQDTYGNTALHCLSWETSNCASFIRLLLELGTDINLQNKEGILPFDMKHFIVEHYNSEEYSLFYNHIRNLEALGMEVHLKNEEYCRMLLDKGRNAMTDGINRFSDESQACSEKQRINEITRMKNTQLTDYIRLYDFMQLEPRRAAIYADNEVLKSIVDDENFKVLYPMYYYLIKLQKQKGENFSKA